MTVLEFDKWLLSGLTLYLWCLTFHIVWAQYPLFDKVRNWLRSKVSALFLNPIIDCPICMTLFWGLVIFDPFVTLSGTGIAILLEAWRHNPPPHTTSEQ
jgi:hypothetical protein